MKSTSNKSRLGALTDEYLRLEHKLKLGGGPEKIEKIHSQGKLTARERIDLLLDPDTFSLEIGLLVAYDEYKGQAPAAAVSGRAVLCQAAALVDRPGGMRLGALLGEAGTQARTRGAADAAGLREGLRQAQQDRRP